MSVKFRNILLLNLICSFLKCIELFANMHVRGVEECLKNTCFVMLHLNGMKESDRLEKDKKEGRELE